jgi:CspA family cold shock protein
MHAIPGEPSEAIVVCMRAWGAIHLGANHAQGVSLTDAGFVEDSRLEAADAPAVDLVEIAGHVKWFDAVKGYGFIVPDNGLPDVLLHVTALRRDGFSVALEGARIVCEAAKRAKGLQVCRIVSMDESTVVHPAQTPSRTHVQVTPTSGFEIAIVKWFNRVRGFGFLTRGDGTQDIFIHMETLRKFGFAELRPGDSVLVRFGDGPKGLMASEVRPIEGARMPVSH